MMKAIQWIAAALLGAACAGASLAQNLLQNPSFETGGALSQNWSTFGNVFREQVAPITGNYSIKLFGNFTGAPNYSGLYQELPATPGQEWTVGVTGTNTAGDAMSGNNRALVKIEFYDASHTVVGSGESDVLTAASPTNTPISASVNTVAPAGTTTARLILLFEQLADNAGGAAFLDDVTASVLGVGAVAVPNASFEIGDGAIPSWNVFNNAIRTTNGPRTGSANLTMSTGTTSGVFQDFAAIPGSVWHGSVWTLNSSTSNPMQLPDYVVMNIEWRDAGNNLISFETVLCADGLSALDNYTQTEINGTAPPGTATARFVLLYNFAGGSGTIQMDDASFERVSSPPPPPPSGNLLNNPGFELALGFNFANPQNWNGFFGGPPGTFLQAFNDTGATPHSENKALVTTIRQGTAVDGFNAFTGHVQIVLNLTEGQVYEYSVWARANPVILDGAEFRIEWQNAAGAEVGRFNMPIQGMLTSDYQKFSITDTAPPGTARAALVVAVQSFSHTGLVANTSVAWDDAFFGAPACAIDFNHDGDVNPDDLGDFITCYFSTPPCSGADFNHDGDTNPDDLGDFNTAYFSPAGC